MMKLSTQRASTSTLMMLPRSKLASCMSLKCTIVSLRWNYLFFWASMYISIDRRASASKGKYSYISLLRQMKDLYKNGELAPNVAMVHVRCFFSFEEAILVKNTFCFVFGNLKHIVGQNEVWGSRQKNQGNLAFLYCYSICLVVYSTFHVKKWWTHLNVRTWACCEARGRLWGKWSPHTLRRGRTRMADWRLLCLRGSYTFEGCACKN